METLKVKQKGQVTIPAKVRRNYEIKEGDLLQLETHAGSIILKPKHLPEPGRPVGIAKQKKILEDLQKLRKTWRR